MSASRTRGSAAQPVQSSSSSKSSTPAKRRLSLNQATEDEDDRGRSAKKQSVDHQSAILHQQKLQRAFWSELDDRLLMAWIIDFQVNGTKEQKKVVLLIDYSKAVGSVANSEQSHEYLVGFLVQHSEALVPPLGAPVKSSKETDFKKAIVILQNVWQTMNRLESNSLAKGLWPGKYVKAAASDEDDDADDDNNDEMMIMICKMIMYL